MLSVLHVYQQMHEDDIFLQREEYLVPAAYFIVKVKRSTFQKHSIKKLCEARAAVCMFVRPRGRRNLRKTSNATVNLKDKLN